MSDKNIIYEGVCKRQNNVSHDFQSISILL